MEKKSALDQALETLNGLSKHLDGMSKTASNQFLSNILGHSRNAVNNVVNTFPKKVERAIPIASMQGGYDLLSNGELSPNKKHNQELIRLNVLKKNVLDQVGFAPEAERYSSKIKIRPYPDPKLYGVATTSYKGRGGHIVDKSIGINPSVFDKGLGANVPADVLVHEYMHMLDKNITGGMDVTDNPLPQKSNSSSGFYEKFSKSNLDDENEIKNFVSSPYYQAKISAGNKTIEDKESFAEYGSSNPGEDILTGQMSSFYDTIYSPASRTMNYSPVYPTSSFLEKFESDEKKKRLYE